jgi:hypothetical protein
MSDNDALSRLYRQLPAEEPSAQLDAHVLAAVNAELEAAREQRARWQRRWRYQVPLATAATLVLAVALLLRQPGSEQELLPPHSEVMLAEYGLLTRETGSDIAADKNAPLKAYELRKPLPPPPPMMAPPPPMSAPPHVPAPVVVAPIDVPTMMDMPAVAPTAAPAPLVAPAAVAVPAPEPAPAAVQIPNIAAIAPMGIIADRALPLAQLRTLLSQATGMPAKEFCTRLQALWSGVGAAPDCPTTDGQHEWPEPLPVAWRVNAGQLQSAELRR